MHATIEISLFKVIYEYDLKLKLRFENEIAEEKIFAIKERVKEINLIR